MKKMYALLIAVLGCTSLLTSCDKGDDNPYGDWKCTCFVTKVSYLIIPPDTTIITTLDTMYLNAMDMDLNTAKSFCERRQTGYTDTLGGKAVCTIK
jgi:hypothetical protein